MKAPAAGLDRKLQAVFGRRCGLIKLTKTSATAQRTGGFAVPTYCRPPARRSICRIPSGRYSTPKIHFAAVGREMSVH
ncbi:hypothetical protein J4732_17370 [Serratia marcescens]|uniref:Uncharacterized protein n=1 Tax=Serratia marcescens TaxID=615 RepID=A0A939NMK6_SERMA|nr:hypothetical protein [Serratia marcescens]